MRSATPPPSHCASGIGTLLEEVPPMAANIGTSGADVWRMNLRQFPAIRILKIGVNASTVDSAQPSLL